MSYLYDGSQEVLALSSDAPRAPRLTASNYPGNVIAMPIAQSKVTAQGQISVPAEVRKKLGIGPGSVLEWDESDDQIVVRRAGKRTSIDVHRALFGAETPKARVETKEAIKRYIRRKHARR